MMVARASASRGCHERRALSTTDREERRGPAELLHRPLTTAPGTPSAGEDYLGRDDALSLLSGERLSEPRSGKRPCPDGPLGRSEEIPRTSPGPARSAHDRPRSVGGW